MAHLTVFIFGLLGNIASFIVFLAPVPTFYRVYKKKSTEGFQSVPYVVALFSATMWLYYATLKPDLILLITINSFGCVIETIYIGMFLAFTTKQARMVTLRLLLLVNLGGFCLILLLSHFLPKGIRPVVLGWMCTSFAVSVFAAPLSIIRDVIRTQSVEFMPFALSFFLTISAVTWLLYGLALKNLSVAIPNVLGLIFGVLQMVLYFVYRKKDTVNLIEEQKIPAEQIKSDADQKVDSIVLAEVQVISSAEANKNDNNEGKENEIDDNERNKNINDDQIARPHCVINMESPAVINPCQAVKCGA